jgi:hypothetical protein
MVSHNFVVEDAADIIGFGIKSFLLTQKINYNIHTFMGSLDIDLKKAADVFYT